jgi:hypothetical protein
MRYFRGIDRLDFEMVLGCFHSDGTIDFGTFFEGSPAGFVDWLDTPDALGGFRRTMHFAGNMLIELSGPSARVETYAVALHDSLPEHAWAGAFVTIWLRYIDHFELRAGRWRIAHRKVLHEWGHSESDKVELRFPVEMQGRRDRDDPSYR